MLNRLIGFLSTQGLHVTDRLANQFVLMAAHVTSENLSDHEFVIVDNADEVIGTGNMHATQRLAFLECMSGVKFTVKISIDTRDFSVAFVIDPAFLKNPGRVSIVDRVTVEQHLRSQRGTTNRAQMN